MTPRRNEAAAPTAIAWDGMVLGVPGGWHPARLGPGYLLLEDADGPAFELKWRRGAGRRGMQAAFKALAPRGEAPAVDGLPGAWTEALAGFEIMPLSWRRDGAAGLGASLYCPECGLAAVFQGLGGPEGPDARRRAELAGVLASLSHHEPGPPRCRVFGLSFSPPDGFVLDRFSFVPGRFSLSYANGRRRLDIVRLAPADVLLARQDLGAVAAAAFGFEDGAARLPGGVAGAPAVWLASRQGTRGLDALMRALGRPGRMAVLRHEAGVNKLLGAACSGPGPVDRDWLAGVAANCVSL